MIRELPRPSCQLPEVNPFIKGGLDVAERIFIMDVNCFKAILNIRTLGKSALRIARTIGRGQQEKMRWLEDLDRLRQELD